RATLRRLEAEPGQDLEPLLRLVNLGLLEQMVAELPAPPITWPAQPLPRELDVSWELERAAIQAAVLPSRPVPADAVPRFRECVLLVRLEPEDRSEERRVGKGR